MRAKQYIMMTGIMLVTAINAQGQETPSLPSLPPLPGSSSLPLMRDSGDISKDEIWDNGERRLQEEKNAKDQNTMLPPPLLLTERETPLAKQCEAQGHRWSMGRDWPDHSPVSYCLTPSIIASRNKCHARDKMWVWSKLSQKFECVKFQTPSEFTEAERARCKGTWQKEPPSGGYSLTLTYCASEAMMKDRMDCLDNQQGQWFWNGITHHMECHIPAAITDCKAREANWIVNQGLPHCMSNADLARQKQAKEDCDATNGAWGPRGMLGMPGCVHTMPDAGKPCQSNEECVAKECVVNPQTKESGMCKDTDSHFGCTAYFKPGTNGLMGICVD